MTKVCSSFTVIVSFFADSIPLCGKMDFFTILGYLLGFALAALITVSTVTTVCTVQILYTWSTSI